MPTRDPATKGVACSRSAYAGSSGITIPKPIRSMKTVRKRTTSGERWKPGGDTARGNRKGAPQSSEAVWRRSILPTLQQRGDTHELGEARGLHLGHDLAAVNLDRLLGDSELARDGPVRPPRHDELHHLALPRGEPREALAELLALRLGAAHLAVHLEGVSDAVEQELAAEGLLDEVDGARLHGPHRRRYVAVSGDHDHREPDVAAGERALEIEPAHPGQADIGHDAAGTPAVLGLQELLRPGIRFDRDVDGAEQVPQTFAHSRVVLDDVDLRVGHHGSPYRPAVRPRAGRCSVSAACSAPGRASRRTFTRTPRFPSQTNCSCTRATSAAVASAATVSSSPAPRPARSASSPIVSAMYGVSKAVRCSMVPGLPLGGTTRVRTLVGGAMRPTPLAAWALVPSPHQIIV